MEVVFIDLVTSFAMARDSMNGKMHMPLQWSVAAMMLRDRANHKRQLYSELIEMRSANYASRIRSAYSKVTARNVSNFRMAQLDNGLIRASNGYYALVEDLEKPFLNVVWAREQKDLLGEKDPEGRQMLKGRDYVYYVGKVPILGERTGQDGQRKVEFDIEDVRDMISQDFKDFKKAVRNKMGLRVVDASSLYGSLRIYDPEGNGRGTVRGSKVVMLANDLASYTITDTKRDRWKIRKYAKFERLNSAEAYAEVNGTNVDEDWIIDKALSNGWNEAGDKRYTTQKEAFQEIVKTWGEESQKIWRNEKIFSISEAPYTVFRTLLYDALMKEMKDKENYQEGFFDSIVEVAPVFFAATKLFWPAVPVAVAATVAAGFAMRKGLNGFKWSLSEYRWYMQGAKSLNPEVSEYLDPDRKNQTRIRKKLSEGFCERHRVLTMDNLPVHGVSQDFENVIDASEDADWIDRWLVTFNNKGYPTFDIGIDGYGEINICTNGLVRYESRDPETWNKTVFSMYVPELDTNSHISIPGPIKEILEDGCIIRSDQLETDQTFTQKSLNKNLFYENIAAIIEHNKTPHSTLSDVARSMQTLCSIFINDALTNPEISEIPFPFMSAFLDSPDPEPADKLTIA